MNEYSNIFSGSNIGEGCYRDVYEVFDGNIMKVSKTMDHFENLLEARIWDSVVGTENAKYLCPVISITEGGRFLLMPKCERIKETTKIKIPEFLTDIKANNFGIYQGRVVCFDYGNTLLLNQCHHKKYKQVTLYV